MDATTTDPLLIDASNIFFGTPYTQDNGQKIIPMSTTEGVFNWDSRVNIQFGPNAQSMVISEWGVNTPVKGSDPLRRNLEFYVPPDVVANLTKFDEQIAKLANQNSNEWFKQAILNKQYLSIVRKDKKGMDIVRVKVSASDRGATECRILNSDGCTATLRPFTDLVKVRDLKLSCIVQTPGIWANATQFGISLTCRSIIAKLPPPRVGLQIFNGFDNIRDTTTSIVAPSNVTDDQDAEMSDDM